MVHINNIILNIHLHIINQIYNHTNNTNNMNNHKLYQWNPYKQKFNTPINFQVHNRIYHNLSMWILYQLNNYNQKVFQFNWDLIMKNILNLLED
ncbi:hypothetical protein TpMuguga_03g02430 [Theileria parva strain Muguga]|uniref:uncharacterized protein n=1 Tax=Theileria parva strain Muguga TaxID=333668 RepID=UPI001C61913C|nr:uncharacterized protein TpMuguga_03g02430 [Theileria parva strain Muguga]KAF5153068.1 hypothetical protein TpMuguga_03g02430 [Theileria parva strain Muguga]